MNRVRTWKTQTRTTGAPSPNVECSDVTPGFRNRRVSPDPLDRSTRCELGQLALRPFGKERFKPGPGFLERVSEFISARSRRREEAGSPANPHGSASSPRRLRKKKPLLGMSGGATGTGDMNRRFYQLSTLYYPRSTPLPRIQNRPRSHTVSTATCTSFTSQKDTTCAPKVKRVPESNVRELKQPRVGNVTTRLNTYRNGVSNRATPSRNRTGSGRASISSRVMRRAWRRLSSNKSASLRARSAS